MRFLKYFESKETPKELLVKYADDIAKVLTTYYSTYIHGDLCDQIDEILWNSSNVDLDGWENDGVLTEDMMKQVVEDYEGAWSREIEKLLDVYYDCIPFVKLVNLKKDIEEVFLEYSDMGTVIVAKNSKFNDDRYEVNISVKDIFFHINFHEVFGRIKDLGFESYHVDGVKNGSSEYMKIEFWKPLPKDIS
jgi:hypothetical protein